jgi:co-chaperonin GroES (HSP10)
MSTASPTVVSYSDSPYGSTVKASQLPEPTGYRILVAPKEVEETTSGGIHLPDERRDKESDASIVFCVLKLGPDAYQDPKKFPAGAWCKEGDWVILPSYAGTRLKIHGMEFRIINDDTVHAVIDDPRAVARA